MNVSLFIIVLMLIIISILLWQFFVDIAKKNTFSSVILRPSEKKEKTAMQENLKFRMMDFSVLLPTPQKKLQPPSFQQKKFSFESCLYLMAPPGETYMGYALLQGLQNVGLVYSEKGLFYYYAQNEVIFSVAPSILPHVFDMERIGITKMPGLKFTLMSPGKFKTMEKIAEQLLEELGGVVRC